MIAVTDHDSVECVDAVAAACAAVGIRVMPGVEVTTSRGHLLCYAPSEQGVEQLRSFMARAGIRPGAEPNCDHVLEIIANELCPTTGTAYASCLVTVAAHAEKPRSMLAGTDSSTSADQLARVARLDAVETTDVDLANQWVSQGIKSRGLFKPLLVGSDAHSLDAVGARHTWLYIHGDLSPSSLRQALASDDVSVQRGGERPDAPTFYLTRVRVEGDAGLHAGLDIDLHPRINAIIGAPSVGKSLIVDILRLAFGDDSQISEVAATSRSRMAATLPAGSVITVDAVVDGEPRQFRREVGGAAALTPSRRPIVFSQGELTRRAMAQQPDLELIDVHADDLESARERHAKACAQVAETTLKAIGLAQEIKQHADTLGNTVDGLDAVNQKLESLSPAQDVARRLQALQAATSWRSRTLAALAPSLDLTVEAPQVPAAPIATEGHEEALSEWVAEDKVEQLISGLRQDLTGIADEYKRKADALLGPDPRLRSALQEAEEALDAKLQEADGKPTEESSELLTRIKTLQDRKVALEELALEKQSLDKELNDLWDTLAGRLKEQADASAGVLQARKDACKSVNKHIRVCPDSG